MTPADFWSHHVTADHLRATERVALAVGKQRNRELLASLLSDYDVVEFTDADRVPEETDVCVVDEAGFARVREALRTWRDAQSPAFAPVLLLVDMPSTDAWRRYADELHDEVDSIQPIPAPRAAIAARVDTLLDTRRYSLELSLEQQLTARIFDTSPLAKTVLDTEGNIVRANERAEEVLGLSKEVLTDRSYNASAWHSVDAEGEPIPDDELPFSLVMATGEPVYGYEHAIRTPDGEQVWLSINVSPIRDDAGDIEYAVATMEDITDRREQAAELDRQVDLFEKTQQLARVGGWEYDVHTDDWWATETVLDVLGLPADRELTADRIVERIDPADRDTLAAAFERALDEGEGYDLTLRLDAERAAETDADTRWIRVQGDPQSEDGELVRIRGTVQDITEQKRRELALQRMSRAVDTAPIGVSVSDPTVDDNPLVYVNDGFVTLTGYSREEAVGRNCRFLQGEHTDPETVAELRAAVDAAEPVSVVIRNYRADGTPFWNHLDIAPVRDDDGDVINYIGFQRDVTERVERQRQLQKLDRYLRHNLRNEMNVVQGMATLIGDEAEPPATDYADSITRHSTALVRTMDKERAITQLLRDDPTIHSVDLLSVIRPLLAAVRADYPDASVSLSAPEAVAVRATPRLSAALEEVVRNAVEHNDAAAPHVDVAVVVDGDEVTVDVADDGPGIPAIEVDALTGVEAETPVDHGQGLGLWLVYLVVRRCGGSVDFADNEPRGSVVSLSLRRADPDEVDAVDAGGGDDEVDGADTADAADDPGVD